MARRFRPMAWARDHPRAFDVALASILTAGGFVALYTNKSAYTGHVARHPNVLSWVLVVLACFVPLTFRRQRPAHALALAIVATLLYQWSHFAEGVITVGPVIAAYSVGAYSADRRRVVRVAAVLIGLFAVGNVISIVSDHRASGPISNLIGNSLVFATAFVVGDNVRRRRERIAHLEERARANDREREMLARQAVVDEQRRIARELHDVIAHSLSVMVVQAGAARRIVNKRPDQAVEALTNIETTGRDALAEMRQLLGVLRGEGADGEAEVAPQPTLGRIDDLANADPDLPVTVTIEGPPAPVPASVDVQAYRIVQEALTNVRKHAGPAQAQVVVRYRPDGVQVVVSDNGRGASAGRDNGHGLSDGHGLVGMRERVALCSGSLHAGPQRGGGWVVDAFFPVVADARSAEGAA